MPPVGGQGPGQVPVALPIRQRPLTDMMAAQAREDLAHQQTALMTLTQMLEEHRQSLRETFQNIRAETQPR